MNLKSIVFIVDRKQMKCVLTSRSQTTNFPRMGQTNSFFVVFGLRKFYLVVSVNKALFILISLKMDI